MYQYFINWDGFWFFAQVSLNLTVDSGSGEGLFHRWVEFLYLQTNKLFIISTQTQSEKDKPVSDLKKEAVSLPSLHLCVYHLCF